MGGENRITEWVRKKRAVTFWIRSERKTKTVRTPPADELARVISEFSKDQIEVPYKLCFLFSDYSSCVQ